MLLNFDLRQRAQKQRKSKLYKHMLDEQIRDNQYYKQKRSRIQTEPIYQYERQTNRSKQLTKDSLKLKQQSLFLPVIAKASINDFASPIQNAPILRKRVQKQRNKSHYRNYSYTKKMEDSDQQLEKCLYDCEQLLGQFGSQSNINNRKKYPKRNSEYYNILDEPIQVQRFKSPRSINQKSNQKRDQIVHMSIPSQPSSYKKFNYSQDFQNKQLKTLKKTKNQTKKPTKDFETIKYLSEHDTILNQQHEFNGNNMKNLQQRYKNKDGYLNEFQQSLQQFKTQGAQNKKIKLKNQSTEKQKLKQGLNSKKEEANKKKIMDEQKESQQIQNEKKIYVLKHLKKAKNRGNLLFKKIQEFRNQQIKKNQNNNN